MRRALRTGFRSPAFAAAAIMLLFAAAVFLRPAWIEGLPLCAFRALSGWDCPGCGLTRAFIALFHGHWTESIRLNAAAPAVAVYFAARGGEALYRSLRGRAPSWYSPEGTRWITALFGVLIFGQWIYKSGLHLYHLI